MMHTHMGTHGHTCVLVVGGGAGGEDVPEGEGAGGCWSCNRNRLNQGKEPPACQGHETIRCTRLSAQLCTAWGVCGACTHPWSTDMNELVWACGRVRVCMHACLRICAFMGALDAELHAVRLRHAEVAQRVDGQVVVGGALRSAWAWAWADAGTCHGVCRADQVHGAQA